MKASFIMQQTSLESWAMDLVKIMGKFGLNLMRRPESIFKAIPPLPPELCHLSAIWESRSLSIKNLSDWDDSLTRISLGSGAYSSSIRPAESYVAILATPITIAPSLGPILGGTLSYAAGWTWMLWFLAIASNTCF